MNGIKDIDVWTFYGLCAGLEYPPRRPVASCDFGDPKFGKTHNCEHFQGRKVACLGRSISAGDSVNPVAALREYLGNAYTSSAAMLAKKAVILIEPRARLGTVVWNCGN